MLRGRAFDEISEALTEPPLGPLAAKRRGLASEIPSRRVHDG
jgi:hypothetical protein